MRQSIDILFMYKGICVALTLTPLSPDSLLMKCKIILPYGHHMSNDIICDIANSETRYKIENGTFEFYGLVPDYKGAQFSATHVIDQITSE